MIITVIRCRPGALSEVLEIDNSLESLQKSIGGGYLEGVRLAPNVHLYCDEDGKFKDLRANRLSPGGKDVLCGTFIISRTDNDGTDVGFGRDREVIQYWREYMDNRLIRDSI